MRQRVFGIPLSIAPSLFFLSFLPFKAMAAQEEIRGFKLQHCAKTKCTSLISEKSLRSNLDQIYVFAQAKLVTSSKDSNGKEIQKEFFGKDGYYDPSYNRIVLRQVNNSHRELVLNLKTGQILYF